MRCYVLMLFFVYQVLTHFVGFGQSWVSRYLSYMPNTCGKDFSFQDRILQAVQKAHQVVERVRQFLDSFLALGSGSDEVEFFVIHLCVKSATAIDERFHLCAHGVEIDGCGEDNHVGYYHFLNHFGGIVFLGAGFTVDAARAASGTKVNRLVAQEYFFYFTPRLGSTMHKLVAQGVSVSSTSWAGGDNQYFLCHNCFVIK